MVKPLEANNKPLLEVVYHWFTTLIRKCGKIDMNGGVKKREVALFRVGLGIESHYARENGNH
jgi:hypothetical protein